MKITVNEEDIRFGARGDCFNCPLARAIARVIKPTDPILPVLVSVGYTDIAVKNCSSKWQYALIQPEVLRFIKEFDFKQTGEPFEFELKLGELCEK